jgi:pyridoxine/pyridoxamine 5'-phosphate oxidase
VNKNFLYQFLRKQKLAVLATIAADGSPQCALVGFAVTPELEIVFDTVSTSRKYANLMTNAKAAFVIGWEHEVTVQYEGVAQQLRGDNAQAYKRVYFSAWPDGPEREKWPNIAYFLVHPRWIRYSDFNPESYKIEEMLV